MVENVLIVLFSGLGALLLVVDAERRRKAPGLTPDRPEKDKHHPAQSAHG